MPFDLRKGVYGMNIYAGNLARDVTEEDLREAFQAFGQVESVTIVKDKFNKVSKGFAFVEMPLKNEAEAAIAGLHTKVLKGRSLDVNEAQPRRDHRSGGRRDSWKRKGGGRRF
jgi:RNA recognition motif-containing protein